MARDIVYRDTGEIQEDVVKVVTQKQDEHIKRIFQMSEENKLFNEKYGGFIFKEDSKKVSKLENQMSSSDIVKNIYLATYLDYDGYLKFESGKKINKSELKSVLAVQDRIFYQWFNSMVKLKVISEESDGIKMNSNYCLKGTINKRRDYNRIFINGVRYIYQNNIGKNQTTVGHIFRLLPYINSYYNILCWNPMEEDEDKLEPITLGDIMRELGIDDSNKKKFITSVSKIRLDNNQPIMIFMTDDDTTKHTVMRINPSITYSGKNDKYKEQILIFELLAKLSSNSSGDRKLKPKGPNI